MRASPSAASLSLSGLCSVAARETHYAEVVLADAVVDLVKQDHYSGISVPIFGPTHPSKSIRAISAAAIVCTSAAAALRNICVRRRILQTKTAAQSGITRRDSTLKNTKKTVQFFRTISAGGIFITVQRIFRQVANNNRVCIKARSKNQGDYIQKLPSLRLLLRLRPSYLATSPASALLSGAHIGATTRLDCASAADVYA